MDLQDVLAQAVRAAREGRREEARDLFLRVVEEDPRCETAWIWLSDLVENPTDRVIALENALVLRPDHPAIRRRLESIKREIADVDLADVNAPDVNPLDVITLDSNPQDQSPVVVSPAVPLADEDDGPLLIPGYAADENLKPLTRHKENGKIIDDRFRVFPTDALAPDDELPQSPARAASEEARRLYREARALQKAGRPQEALEVLLRLSELEPGRVAVWKSIAGLQPSLSEKIAALEKALALLTRHAPGRQEIEQQIAQYRKLQADPWRAARQFEELGEFDQAAALYLSITLHSRSAAERIEASPRLERLKMRQATEKIVPVHPTLNLLRLTAGPVLLFFIMVFIQSGLNPLAIAPLSLVSLGGVTTGSLLVTATGMRPLHPTWVQFFGDPGSLGEKDARVLLRFLGWLLVIVPFVVFFISAGIRLLQLWAAITYGMP